MGGGVSLHRPATKLVPLVASFRGRGGCCLFCYSCILTHGVDKVKAEASLDGGGAPLVSGPFSLCGTELISLLLAGVARCNVAAYEGVGGGKCTGGLGLGGGGESIGGGGEG